MKGEIEVLRPGLFSTIQDRGRFGLMHFGVPICGSMDLNAAGFANMILNNSEDDPVLEITQTGPILKFHSPANIAIAGGNMSPEINNSQIQNNRVYKLQKDDILSFGKRESGSRCYLAVQGGIYLDKVLGSYSWYEGLTSHFRLEKGIKLSFDQSRENFISNTASVRFNDAYLFKSEVSVYPGPEFNELPAEIQQKLSNLVFSIDPANNRMAVQLKEVLNNELKPIITGPVIPGTVQLTPSGKLIILMRDCQTTGGYPRVLQVSDEGLNILAQKFTGDNIAFNILGNI